MMTSQLRADVRRSVGAALAGCAAVAVLEYFVSVLAAEGSVRIPTLFRFAALDVTLLAIAALLAVPLVVLVVAGARLCWAAFDREAAAAWHGLGAKPAVRRDGPHRAIPWIFAALVVAGAYLGGSFGLTHWFVRRYKELNLIAASLALLQLGLIVVCALLMIALGLGLRAAARALHPRLGMANPLGQPGPALAAVLLLVVPPALWILRKLPQLEQQVPWRDLIALAVFVVAASAGARWVSRREGGSMWPADPRKRRMWMLGVAGGLLLLAPPSLALFGADGETKYLAIRTDRAPLGHLVRLVRWANDFDRDGYGTLLGEGDCAPFNRKISPVAHEIADNGIDENCNGHDFSSTARASWKSGEKMPIPDQYLGEEWNILLITIDTVRYDHTTFGGYERNTTPHLAKLVDRAVSFEFANAPSAGTMASVPAIIMSKYFHSGIWLGPERRPKPPLLLEENVTMAEMVKRAGYRTGAIVSHEYFNNWGIEQGFDSYDNEIGAKPNPTAVTSHELTSKAEAWIARQGGAKWFLWVHYIDPHGRYVAHPGHTQFGDPSVEKDLYDGELAYTDEYVGKLLETIQRSGTLRKKTVIIITSDHGDGFMEHNFINHGQKLYKELLHVPLIFYVPDIEPHTVAGPVSNLDIFPTVADLIGVDITDLQVEGESLVAQLFYARDARDRTVFAETNYPDPLRAVITDKHKLIFNLKANVYELYDLHADPWEKRNIWGKNDKAGEQKMKALLDEWLDRVYYSRDPSNQAQRVRSAVLLSERPKMQHETDAVAAGAIKVIGWDTAKPAVRPGEPITLVVYFECLAETEHNYRLEAEAWTGAPRLSVRAERIPGEGVFQTNRWKKGELVKETFLLRVPPTWTGAAVGDKVQLGVRLLDEKRQPAPMTGASIIDGKQAAIGELPFAAKPGE